MKYAWEGMPLCEHGYQFDCCQGDRSLIDQTEDAARAVFNELGSGHTEAVFEAALELELSLRSIGPIQRQVPCPIYYKGFTVGIGIIDLLVETRLIIEIKAISKLTSKEEIQVRKYLLSTNMEKGLLINFPQGSEEVEIITVSLNKEDLHDQAVSSESGNS